MSAPPRTTGRAAARSERRPLSASQGCTGARQPLCRAWLPAAVPAAVVGHLAGKAAPAPRPSRARVRTLFEAAAPQGQPAALPADRQPPHLASGTPQASSPRRPGMQAPQRRAASARLPPRERGAPPDAPRPRPGEPAGSPASARWTRPPGVRRDAPQGRAAPDGAAQGGRPAKMARVEAAVQRGAPGAGLMSDFSRALDDSLHRLEARPCAPRMPLHRRGAGARGRARAPGAARAQGALSGMPGRAAAAVHSRADACEVP